MMHKKRVCEHKLDYRRSRHSQGEKERERRETVNYEGHLATSREIKRSKDNDSRHTKSIRQKGKVV